MSSSTKSSSRGSSTMGFFKYRYSAVQEDIDEEDIQFIQDAEIEANIQAHEALRIQQPTEDTYDIDLTKRTPQDKYGLTITKTGHCLFIVCVRKNTVGHLARMRFGDEIVAINGEPVESLRTRQAARLIVANDSCTLTMRKDTRATDHVISYTGNDKSVGLRLEHGISIKVRAFGPADRAGIRLGDAIIEVNGKNSIGHRSWKTLEKIKTHGEGCVVRTMPCTLFNLMMKGVDPKLLKECME